MFNIDYISITNFLAKIELILFNTTTFFYSVKATPAVISDCISSFLYAKSQLYQHLELHTLPAEVTTPDIN